MGNDVLVTTVQIYRGRDEQFRWRALAGNNEVVAESGEGYHHYTDCRTKAVELFPGATLDVANALTGHEARYAETHPAEARAAADPGPRTTLAERIADAVLDDLKRRKGVGGELEEIEQDDDTYAELKVGLARVVDKELGTASLDELLSATRDDT